MRAKDLQASAADLDLVQTAVGKTKKGSKTVRVPIDAVQNILIDYHRLYDIAVMQDAPVGNVKWRRKP